MIRDPGAYERGAAPDLWRRTLSQLPTAFGRLVYLASLRNSNTGTYEHFGLAQAYGDEVSHCTLKESHEGQFASWLCFSLEQQKRDLDEYLTGLEGEKRVVIATWLRLSPYRNLVPAAAREAERRLFTTDLDALLEVLRAENAVAAPDPDA